MPKPTTREEFKEYCLRKLGKPVIEINVDDDQIEDRIDEALSYYWDYHFDGTEVVYYKHQITEEDKLNRYFTVPDNIIGAVRVFPLSNTFGGTTGGDNGLFNLNYQIATTELHTLTSGSLVPYYMAMEHLALISELIVGQQPIRYSRHRNRLHVDMHWDRITTGRYLVIEAYQVIDPEEFSNVWNDRWLQNYATAKIKYQWGSNLTKFIGMSLPGGVQFNGEQIFESARQEIEVMEQKMLSSYSLPVSDMIG